jgi:cyclopropane fatty-acyl-phospholipid synthase-like methyltransferase
MLKDSGSRSQEGRWHSGPADRNAGPITEVLRAVLPERGEVLEIASGTGQHVIAFATAFPGLIWHPSDCDAELRRSVELRIAEANLDNIRAPIELDVMRLPWTVGAVDTVVCINMIHVAPWPATDALFTGAAQVLRTGGSLVTYGPYMRDGRHTAPSNAAFDASLRTRDRAWGLRDLSAVTEAADSRGFERERLIEMPANNFSLVFVRRAA